MMIYLLRKNMGSELETYKQRKLWVSRWRLLNKKKTMGFEMETFSFVKENNFSERDFQIW